MSDRFDVISFRKTKTGKVYAVRLGSASKREGDEGFSCWLDAIPAPGPSGQYEIQIVPQRDKPAAARSTGRVSSDAVGDELSDPLPF